MKRCGFAIYHPGVNFAYFFLVIGFSMFFMHPFFLFISFFGAFIYSVYINGKGSLKFMLRVLLPMFIIVSIVNPVFNHKGATILFYLKSGNPVTLESIFYGLSTAAMFSAVLLWFSSYNVVMTSDKFIYLFGRFIPALSLIFSMVLRFVPRYKEQIKNISHAQKCVGKDVTQGSITQRAKNGIKILSIMITWALENAIETANSMKGRGYGLPRRSSFSIYRFGKRDKLLFFFILGLGATISIGAAKGHCTTKFFPMLKFPKTTIHSRFTYVAYALLCLIPVLINIREVLKWKYIKSRT